MEVLRYSDVYKYVDIPISGKKVDSSKYRIKSIYRSYRRLNVGCRIKRFDGGSISKNRICGIL